MKFIKTALIMKKDNALKRAARWVARMFGYKAENKFARVLWYVFATCASIIVLFIVIVLVVNLIDGIRDYQYRVEYRHQQNDPAYLHDYDNEYLSADIIYHDGYPSYLYHTIEKRRTLSDIQWICQSSDGDSLAVCCIDNERGYFNRYSGEMAISPQYDKAWVFSEGVACVMRGWRMAVIDHQGKVLFEKSFPYKEGVNSYCFHNGLCPMSDGDGKLGLINKEGNWVVEPAYNYVEYKNEGLWRVWDAEGIEGLLDRDGKVFLPVEFSRLSFNKGHIFATTIDHVDQVYDFDGQLVNSCSFDEIELMEYESDEYEYSDVYETKVRKTMAAGLMKYRTSDYRYGLMDKEGNIVTPPLYTYITAIGHDRYQCDGPTGAVILDGKGREYGVKL